MAETAQHGVLYLVATPIGNLNDLSARAVETLRTVDLIAAEDTRRSKILLDHFEIKTPLESFHDHSGPGKTKRLVERLTGGASVALITDGGSPLISDPGFPLVREVIAAGLTVTTVPGPSAVLAALSVSGFPCARFIFEGFFPVKSAARRRRISEITEESRTVVYFESPYRLLKALRDLAELLPEREICVAKELTKKFEEVFRGRPGEILAALEKRSVKGEYVIVVRGNRA